MHSTVSPDVGNVDEMVEAACRAAGREGFAVAGDPIAITAGMPFGQAGTTNLLRLAEIQPQTAAATRHGSGPNGPNGCTVEDAGPSLDAQTTLE